MMSWRTLETVVWFLGYGAICAFLLTWNSASPTYNAVYIEQTVADWLPGATLVYEPGSTISGDAPSPYFRHGWWRPEPSGRWGRGSRNELELLPTTAIPAGSRLVARLGVLPLRGIESRPVIVFLNGLEIARVDASGGTHVLDVMVPELPATVPVHIEFVVEPAKSALSQGISTDQRELGVRLVELTLGASPE